MEGGMRIKPFFLGCPAEYGDDTANLQWTTLCLLVYFSRILFFKYFRDSKGKLEQVSIFVFGRREGPT